MSVQQQTMLRSSKTTQNVCLYQYTVTNVNPVCALNQFLNSQRCPSVARSFRLSRFGASIGYVGVTIFSFVVIGCCRFNSQRHSISVGCWNFKIYFKCTLFHRNIPKGLQDYPNIRCDMTLVCLPTLQPLHCPYCLRRSCLCPNALHIDEVMVNPNYMLHARL